jgi:hypothetical protein
VIFTGGAEVAVVEEPRLLEVLRADGVASLAGALESFATGAWVPVERAQASSGGSNPRFPGLFDADATADLAAPAVQRVLVVTDRTDLAAALTAALDARGVRSSVVPPAGGFAGAARALDAAVAAGGPVDGVIAAAAGRPAVSGVAAWEQVLAEHDGIAGHIGDDAGWARAVADHAAATERPVRLVTLTDAVTAGGRSRAQAAAQLARASWKATKERVAAFSVSVEGSGPSVNLAAAGLAAHLLCNPGAVELSGAELVAAPGWLGLRSHPRPSASITYGGPDVPAWLDDALRRVIGAEEG